MPKFTDETKTVEDQNISKRESFPEVKYLLMTPKCFALEREAILEMAVKVFPSAKICLTPEIYQKMAEGFTETQCDQLVYPVTEIPNECVSYRVVEDC